MNKVLSSGKVCGILILLALLGCDRQASRLAAEHGKLWGGFERALPYLNTAIELDPENDLAYFQRGSLRMHLEQYELATQDFGRVIELDPLNASAYFHRGTLGLYLEKYEQAAQDFERVIELEPENASAYLQRGSLRLHLEQYDQATQDFERVIELEPKNALPYAKLGYLRSQVGPFDLAAKNLRQAIELDIDGDYPYETYNGLAWLLATCTDASVRDGREAVRLAKLACEFSFYRNEDILDTLAAAYAETGDFDAAIEWQQKAILRIQKRSDLRDRPEKLADFKSRLDLYAEGTAYREKPNPSKK